jgi:hypothetical protein
MYNLMVAANLPRTPKPGSHYQNKVGLANYPLHIFLEISGSMTARLPKSFCVRLRWGGCKIYHMGNCVFTVL